MPFSKLKNLMILILAALNVLLLCLVIPLVRERHDQRELAAEQLEALFETYGVRLDGSSLPDDLLLYTLEFSPDSDAALPAMRALLGEAVYVQDDSTRYLSQYQSNQGRCQLTRGGSLDARLTGRVSKNDLAKATAVELEAMGVTAASISLPSRQSAGVYTVTAVQALLDVPVFSSTLEFTYDNGVLTRIEGTVFLDTSSLVRTDDIASIGCTDALVAFLANRDSLGWVGSAVTEVAQGYFRAETASAAVVRLVPGWRIATDTGAFWVNGITREVLFLET